MGFRSLLYWFDRAFEGDRRPIWFIAVYLGAIVMIGGSFWLFG